MMNQPLKRRQNLRQRLAVASGSLAMSLTALLLTPTAGQAAERIYLTFGILGRSIAISDLRDFAETGELTRQLQWYLNVANVNPEDFRAVLTREVQLNLEFVDSVAYSLPGEYALYQIGRVVHTKSRQGATQISALRSALLVSLTEDNQISILEFLESYPTPEVFVDGVILARTARDVRNFVDRIEPTIAVIQEFLANLICDCEAPRASMPSSTDSGSIGASGP
jgi:Alpha/beta hydrolase of unknown function (DUF1400)